jgi:ribosomal protein S18 acetylase RimI-like enzyme
LRFRFARPGDEQLLTELERSASLAQLTHIFPPDVHPYPDIQIQHRWRQVLNDRSRLTLIAEVDGRPAGYASYGDEVIQHLGVAGEFQRQGVGSALIEAAEDQLFADLSTSEIGLWVLEDNHVARAFYTEMGWNETGETKQAEFPPYPVEVRMFRRNPHLARHGR